MIVLIDNYDSFSYNLYQLIGTQEKEIRVVRNDSCTIRQIEAMRPQAIVLSPGPGRPENAGVCQEAVLYFADKVPVLGVCLGHQVICQAFGGVVSYAKKQMHGKQSMIIPQPDSKLFRGLENPFPAGRYHSLAAAEVPAQLRVTARSEEGEVMAVEHRKYPVFGVQFHPESVLTPAGEQMIRNFMEVVRR